MDCEDILNRAIDHLADFEEEAGHALLNGLISELKNAMDATATDAERHYYWGRALRLMDEPEQALLRLEQALQIVSDHEQVWWETVSILLHDLDRPESAKTVLDNKLLPLHPDNLTYMEAKASAETLIRRRKNPSPPDAGEA